MALKIKSNELKKFLKNNNIEIEKPKKRNNGDRLDDAINLLLEYQVEDTIAFNEDSTKCLLTFENVILISMNDSLRLGARRMARYKSLWHERVKKLISEEVMKKWSKSKEETLLVEFLYQVKTNNFMDYDGRISALKAPLDGLTVSGMIYDDSEKYIPLIFGKQKKSKNGVPKLQIILSVEKNPDRFFSDEFKTIINE